MPIQVQVINAAGDQNYQTNPPANSGQLPQPLGINSPVSAIGDGAGNVPVYTVSATNGAKLVLVTAQYNANGAGTRYPLLNLIIPGMQQFFINMTDNEGITGTWYFGGAIGLSYTPQQPGIPFTNFPLPDIYLPFGSQILVNTPNVVAGDEWNYVQVMTNS